MCDAHSIQYIRAGAIPWIDLPNGETSRGAAHLRVGQGRVIRLSAVALTYSWFAKRGYTA